jgi:hypothetical protein
LGARSIDFSNRKTLEEGAPSDNGTVTLAWEKPADVSVELQQSGDATFGDPVTRYQGDDPASVITGLAEGTHFFRLRETGGDGWSPPLQVEVEFFPRARLFVLLGAGAVVVVSTVAAIVIGHLRTAGKGEGA